MRTELPSIATKTQTTGPHQEPARLLKEQWDGFKVELFQEFEKYQGSKLENALNTYYQEVYKLNSVEIDQESQVQNSKNFLELGCDDKRKVLWKVFKDFRDSKYDQAFNNLAASDRDDLLKGLAFHVGTQEMRSLKPCLKVETEVDNYFRERIKNFKPPLGIEFLHSGSNGTAFKVLGSKPYVLKVSNEKDTSDPNRAYRIGFEKAGIEKAQEVSAKQNRLWLQQLAKNPNAKYFGLDEENQDGVLATKYLPGVTLDASVTVDRLEQYAKKGFTVSTLKNFMFKVFKLASAGVDLSALTHVNIIFDPKKRSLSLIDFVGLDNSDYDKMREFIKNHPLRFTLLKMISDVVLLQSSKAENLRKKIEEASGSSLSNFTSKRFQLLCQSLDQVFRMQLPGFSKDEVVKELAELEKTCAATGDEAKTPFGAKFALTQDGIGFITKLKDKLLSK